LERVWQIFISEIDKPSNPLKGAMKLSVAQIVDAGADNNEVVEVIQAPTETNPAHAEIRQRLSRKLSLRLTELATWIDLPG
jgi:hypothetical protein